MTWFTSLTLVAYASVAHAYSKDLHSAVSTCAVLSPPIAALKRATTTLKESTHETLSDQGMPCRCL